jgi:hypothetical protein
MRPEKIEIQKTETIVTPDGFWREILIGKTEVIYRGGKSPKLTKRKRTPGRRSARR